MRAGRVAGREAWHPHAPVLAESIGVDAGTGRIVASSLVGNDVDDGSQVGPLLGQVAGSVASFTGDGAYDGTMSPPASPSAIPRRPSSCRRARPRCRSGTAETAPTQRDQHLRFIAEHGRMAWQKASGYTEACPSGGRHRQVQARDRRQAAFARGGPPGDRGGRRRPGAQPDAGAWTPKLRPHRVNPNGDGTAALTPPICATQSHGYRPQPRSGPSRSVGYPWPRSADRCLKTVDRYTPSYPPAEAAGDQLGGV